METWIRCQAVDPQIGVVMVVLGILHGDVSKPNGY